ncbi:MAG: ROK family protein [Kiritimatiellae bacterium]|nr:ROK family protein [Kiritimatiellia bacterium]
MQQPAQGIRHEDMRRNNRRAAMRLLLRHGVLSKSQIARLAGFDPKTAGNVITELAQLGWVKLCGALESKGRGRKGVGVELAADRPWAVGLSVEPERVVGLRVGLTGKILARETKRLKGNDSAQTLEETVLDFARRLARGAARRSCLGLGVVAPGILSEDGRRWLRSVPLPQLVEASIHASLSGAVRAVPVRCEDASRGRAVCEACFGARQRDFVVIDMGKGIGAGFFLNGRLIRGVRGASGEIGHFVVEPGKGRRCGCGNVGCLETIAGYDAIAADYRARAAKPGGKGPARATIETVLRAAQEGDAAARAVLQGAAQVVGRVVANVVNLLDVSVYLHGALCRQSELFVDTVRETAGRHTIATNKPIVQLGAFGDDAAALGAAALMMEEYLL